MKRFMLALTAVAAALALAQAASAKDIESMSVCGANGCEKLSGDQSAPFIAVFEGGGGSGGASQTVLDAVPIGPYYKIGVRIRGDHPPNGGFSFTTWYVRPDLLHLSDPGAVGFKRLPASFAAELNGVAEHITPYPTPRVVSAYVGDTKVAHPAQYIGLFGKLPTTDATLDDDTSKWINIALKPNRANPWFTDSASMIYSYTSQSLFLMKPVKVSDDLAKTIARDAGLPVPAGGGNGWGRPVGFGILVAWLVVATLLFLWWRRPKHPEARPTTA